jgi:Putative prokaryotic signal transducing protein
MKELIRTNDAVLLSYIDALLNEADIPHEIADTHMSIMDGSIGVLPRRMLVADEGFKAAREIVRAADIELPRADDD